MRSITQSLLLAAALIAACGPTTPVAVPGPGSGAEPGPGSGVDAGDTAGVLRRSAVTQMSLAEAGLEASALDRTANPCDDFYQYACGGWLAANEIPGDKSRYGRFSELSDKNELLLHDILESVRQPPAPNVRIDKVMGSLGAYYGACMDEEAIEKADLTALTALRTQVSTVKSAKAVATAILAMHQAGLQPVFTGGTEADYKDSSTYALFIDTSGMGLPDRDYYLEDSFKEKRAAYLAHVTRFFQLLGRKPAVAGRAAADVLSIETELAKLTMVRSDRQDPSKIYHPYTLDALKKLAPLFDWAAWLSALGNPGLATVVVNNPPFLEGVNKLIKTLKPAMWANYLEWRAVRPLAETLPKRFDDEAFELTKALRGVEVQPERWKRCVGSVNGALGQYLGQPFVDKAFPGESKDSATSMVREIQKALLADIRGLSWMTDTTKEQAQLKLSKLGLLIGFPDTWREYDFTIDRATYTSNALAAALFESHRQVSRAGKPVDRDEWLMSPQIVNAYYNPNVNNTALPAGILQPPFFGKDRIVAANLGGVGMVVGHELTHGFDDTGAQFDEVGNQRDWWQEADKKQFVEKGQCVVDQYNAVEALPGKTINGKLTIGENIADLGGVKMAFRAYRNLRAGAAPYQAEGFSEDQMFFLAVGQAWCSKDREDETKLRLVTDPHSPPHFRVNGALRNLPDFATAFQCSADAPMAPTNRCEVW